MIALKRTWMARCHPMSCNDLRRWLLEHCSRVDSPQPGDLLLCQGQAAGAFAVVSAVGGMIHLRESGMVGHQLSVPSLLPLFRPLP